MAVEIRFVQRDEYPLAAEALDRLWAPNHVYCRDRALFDWTFRRPGLWEQDSYCFVLAWLDGEVAGTLGAIPYLFNDLGRLSRGFWPTNWIVREDARGHGIGTKLTAVFSEPPSESQIHFGINDVVANLHARVQAQLVPDLPRHFLALPGQAARLAEVLRVTWPDWTAEQAETLAAALEYRRARENATACERSLPADWDAKAWSKRAPLLRGAVRDHDYLNWRYCQHPTFQYRLVVVPEGDDYGLLVWRLETIRKRGAAGLEDLDCMGRVVEFLPCSEANAADLLGHLLSDAEAAAAFGVDFYGHHGPTREWLQALGFPLVAAIPDGMSVPSRFQPLDNRGGRIRSAIWGGDWPAPPDPPSPTCPWYWTKSDGDQDRPN